MTLDDIIRALSGNNGDPEAARYLNDPSSNPAVDRVRPYPLGIPPPPTTGPDGRRLPFPRIIGGAPPERIVGYQRPQYPLVYGPGAGAGANELSLPTTLPRQQMGPGAPVFRFSDATRQVGPEMVDSAPPLDNEPWRQPAPTPMYQGGGIYAGLANEGLAQGAPAMRLGLEPPSAPQQPIDDEADWNAALARVRANMGRDPTGLRAERERDLDRLRGRARRAEMVASAPDRYNWPRTIR